MSQDKVPKYQIIDTGQETKTGSVVYNRAQDTWLELLGSSFAPQINYMLPDYESPLKDRDAQEWEFTSKRVVGKNAPTFNITLYFNENKYDEMKTLFEMGDTFGLKKIKGGIGILENLPFANESGECFFTIQRFSPSESIGRGTNIISVTLSGVFV